VTITATVTATPPGTGTPTGFVSFWDGQAFITQIPLKANKTASVTLNNPIGTSHAIQAIYSSDMVFASSSATLVALPPYLIANISLSDAVLRLTFSNLIGAPFTVLSTPDISLPLSNWSVLGPAIEVTPGQFQFSDADATNSPQRFYRVRSP
jgi:hypothetical protein